MPADRWGDYAPAIARWEQAIGRPAPDPTKPGRTGNPRLNPQLVEWMMGWPPGHVTNVPGVTDPQALRICGNGVVPQQAAAALTWLLAQSNSTRPWDHP
jgi:DNA (cytosine-5)-methyltransferase 1